MKFNQSQDFFGQGPVVVDLELLQDDRGFFARTFCRDQFEAQGLNIEFVQSNISFNPKAFTLRGMHYQRCPAAEAKLVRCTRGIIYDVAVDVRPNSPTYLKWMGLELSADNRRALYVPEGFAHGYLTLTDDSEVFYQVSEFYTPQFEQGIRYNDPAIGILWPRDPKLISDKDANHPLLEI